MYTIKRAAELTGISVATLRAWERRYGVVSPQRSDGGYRLYGPEDVRALAIMNSLVNEGWSAREAAAETTRRLSSRDAAGREAPFGRGDRESRSASRRPAAPRRPLPVRGRRGVRPRGRAARLRVGDGGPRRPLRPRHLRARRRRLAHADPRSSSVRPGRTAGSPWPASTSCRMPSSGASQPPTRPRRAASTARPCSSGSRPAPATSSGLLAFAVAARRAGFATVYVGADLPVEDWLRAIEARRAAGMVMAVPRDIDIATAQEIVDTVSRTHPEVVIGLGGSQQNEINGTCVHLGHSITVAVGEMMRRLRVPA